MTLVLGALDREVDALAAALGDRVDESALGRPVYRGRIDDHPVIVSRTGVGKSMSALFAQHLVDRYAPKRIVFTGVAGSLNRGYELGDVVVARDCVQHDMDVTSMGFELGRIPYTDYRFLPADPALLEIARAIRPPRGRAHVGRILTGDRFVTDAGLRDRLAAALDGDAVEMEGASVALVAAVNALPFLLIRTISDHSDGTALDFERLLDVSAANSLHYVRELLARL